MLDVLVVVKPNTKPKPDPVGAVGVPAGTEDIVALSPCANVTDDVTLFCVFVSATAAVSPVSTELFLIV